MMQEDKVNLQGPIFDPNVMEMDEAKLDWHIAEARIE